MSSLPNPIPPKTPTPPDRSIHASESEPPSSLHNDPFLFEILEIFSDFFEGFGFKANVGRIWASLFYSIEPLSQKEIASLLGLSAGMVSQGLQELGRFGMILTQAHPERRETLYQTERNLMKIVSSILGRREEQTIDRLMQRIEEVKARMAISPSPPESLKLRMEGLDQVLVICNLAKAIISLVEAFAHYSYHAVSLGARALARLRISQLPEILGFHKASRSSRLDR